MPTYALDNAWQRARQRLSALEAWLDPGTICHLEARGVAPGWHCLEVGAGGGSIASWLGDRVGPAGSVLATDIDPRHVEALAHSHVRALRHDIIRDPLPADTFDLVHTRFVLTHLPAWETALDRMIAALKPGGCLVVEEMDFPAAALDPGCGAHAVALFDKALTAHHQVMDRHGMNPFFGRCLLQALQTREIIAIGAEGRTSCSSAGSPEAITWRLTYDQLREEIVAIGAMTDDEMAALFALLEDPATTFLTQMTVTGWGQRPSN